MSSVEAAPSDLPSLPGRRVTDRHSFARRNPDDTSGGWLFTVMREVVTDSGKWGRWQSREPRLREVSTFHAAAALHVDSELRLEVVMALTRLGSRRGGDDPDAAIAVVALLAPGVGALVRRSKDVCEKTEVVAVLWEKVRAAEPTLGHAIAYNLLRRTRETVVRRGRTERSLMVHDPSAFTELLDLDCGPGSALSIVASQDAMESSHRVSVDDPAEDVSDLLAWGVRTGRIKDVDLDLLVELLAAENDGAPIEEAQRIAAASRGICLRTIRRHRDRAIAALRDAAPEYLAAVG